MSKTSTQRPYHVYAAVLLLWLLFAQAVTSLSHLSVTFDEPVHITTGYSIWETGDLRLMDDHPPLLELWMSWPLHLSPETPVTEEVSTWELGDRRLFAYADEWWAMPIDTWLIPARVTVTLLGVILGTLVFRWATDWFGSWGGLLALALLTFDPNVIAHASLSTLDLGIALLIFATMYAFQGMLTHPTPLRVIGTGLLLGASLAAKISGGVLVPVTSLMMLGRGWQHWERRKILPRYVLYGVTAALALWAVHLFQIGQIEGTSITAPAPTFWRSFLNVGGDVSTQQRPAFLLGKMYTGGRWYYFPMAFLLKTPLTTILLTAVALSLSRRFLRSLWRTVLLATLPATYLVISMLSAVNIGYRHILPILPFLYVFIGGLSVLIEQRPGSRPGRRWAAVAILLLIGWEAASTLSIWPWHLTYFNEAAGGPENGYRLMTDSNVDWNQALKAVRDYVEQHGAEDVYLSIFTRFVPLRLYNLEEVTPLPPLPEAPPVLPYRYNPKPGTYIISASTLRGLRVVDPEMYNWFWHREPDELIANAMLVYHVEEPTPRPGWVAQCSTPVAPLSTEEIKERFRSERSLIFRAISRIPPTDQ
ncbi:MAG: ArnT family glycosyltransferase, partial [Anaerolineae bacterium]